MRVLEAERTARRAGVMQVATINSIACLGLLNVGTQLALAGHGAGACLLSGAPALAVCPMHPGLLTTLRGCCLVASPEGGVIHLLQLCMRGFGGGPQGESASRGRHAHAHMHWAYTTHATAALVLT